MLSKLVHFSQAQQAVIQESMIRERLLFLQSYYPRSVIEPFPTCGTLGTFYVVRASEGTLLIKSHIPEKEYRQRLSEEAALLKSISPYVFFDYLENKSSSFLVMRKLQPIERTLTINETRGLCQHLQSHADSFPEEMDTIFRYFDFFDIASAHLLQKQFVTKRTYAGIQSDIGLLKDWTEALSRKIPCHGDFSRNNVLAGPDGRMHLIDFEDVFWGYPDYDLLYWLTFYENRNLYRSGLLSELNLTIPVSIARATMEMIVILKSYLSILSGEVQNHRLRISDRVAEVQALFAL